MRIGSEQIFQSCRSGKHTDSAGAENPNDFGTESGGVNDVLECLKAQKNIECVVQIGNRLASSHDFKPAAVSCGSVNATSN